MTDEEMQALRAAAEKATPGPWIHEPGEEGLNDIRPCVAQPAGWVVAETVRCIDGSPEEANAAYIALANPAAVLALLDRVAAAEARAETMRDALETIARRDFNCAIHQHGMAAAGLAHETLNASAQETQR